MTMELTKYMVDKMNGHVLTMDMIMALSVVEHYEQSGGLLLKEFKKLIGPNYDKVLNGLIKQSIVRVDEDYVCVTYGLESLKERANLHFDQRYSDVISVF